MSVLPCTETRKAQPVEAVAMFFNMKEYSLASPPLIFSQYHWSSSSVSGFSHHHSWSFSTRRLVRKEGGGVIFPYFPSFGVTRLPFSPPHSSQYILEFVKL